MLLTSSGKIRTKLYLYRMGLARGDARKGEQERIQHLTELLPYLLSHDLRTPFIGHSEPPNFYFLSLAKNCPLKDLRPLLTPNSYWLAQGS
jgi:hypothetical protein